jgi:hypothetical protein
MAADELQRVRTEAQAQGWRVVEVTKGWMLYPSDPALSPVLVHKTESDHRAVRNTISRMRQRGFRWPPTKEKGK